MKNNVINSVNVRKSAKNVFDLVCSLKGACAQINAVMSEKFDYEGTTMTVREWLECMDYNFGANGITPTALQKVWHKEMRISDGKNNALAMWRIVPATYQKDEESEAKRVYTFDDTKKKFVGVGEYHLVKIESWSARLIIKGLIDTWTYSSVKNQMKRHTEKVRALSEMYVTKSEKATRKNINTEMVRVDKKDVKF